MEILTEPTGTTLSGLIDEAFERHLEGMRTTSRGGILIEAVELEAEGIITCLVLRAKDKPAERMINVMCQGEKSWIENEDCYYLDDDGKFLVTRYRHNSSGEATVGFGTKFCSGTRAATDGELEELARLVATGRPHRHPKARI